MGLTAYPGYVCVLNNTGAGLRTSSSSIKFTLQHTIDSKTSTVFGNEPIGANTVSGIKNFYTQPDHNDNWKIILEIDTQSGSYRSDSFKANFKEEDSKGIIVINLFWSGVQEYTAELVFPRSGNVNATLKFSS